jgi:hypothetical protein
MPLKLCTHESKHKSQKDAYSYLDIKHILIKEEKNNLEGAIIEQSVRLLKNN